MITISIFLLILLKNFFIASKALRFAHDWALMQTIIGLVALFIFIFTSPTFLHTIFLTFGSFSCCSINMMTVHTHRHAERHWRTRYCTRPFLWFTFPLFMRNGVSTCRCGITTDICTGDSLFFFAALINSFRLIASGISARIYAAPSSLFLLIWRHESQSIPLSAEGPCLTLLLLLCSMGPILLMKCMRRWSASSWIAYK